MQSIIIFRLYVTNRAKCYSLKCADNTLIDNILRYKDIQQLHYGLCTDLNIDISNEEFQIIGCIIANIDTNLTKLPTCIAISYDIHSKFTDLDCSYPCSHLCTVKDCNCHCINFFISVLVLAFVRRMPIKHNFIICPLVTMAMDSSLVPCDWQKT